MTRARKQALAVHEQTYRRFYHDPIDRFTCFYCGLRANCFDHQPAVSRIADYRALGLVDEAYVKVPACNECNRVIGNELSESLLQRHNEVKARLERKYRRLLRSPEWDLDDLSTLRGRLKGHVKSKDEERRFVQQRLDYVAGVEAFIDAWESRRSDFVGVFE